MNEANTQAGQDAQSLQPGAAQTQETASQFQAGSDVNLSNGETANALNQGMNTSRLSVGVSSSGSRTATTAPTPANSSGGLDGVIFYVIVALLVALGIILFTAFRRSRKIQLPEETPVDVIASLDGAASKPKKTKKKRKKPKKPHHH